MFLGRLASRLFVGVQADKEKIMELYDQMKTQLDGLNVSFVVMSDYQRG